MENPAKVVIQLQHNARCALKTPGLIVARGVKYGQAERFQPPQPCHASDSITDCTGPGTICPQLPSRLEFLNGQITAGRMMDEDCLHVSIFGACRSTGPDLIPVMLFFHNSTYSSSSSDLECYSSTNLTSNGVVVVNVTYRLGIFGYQPIDRIAPTNLGLQDQIAALRWIHANIETFGGDSRRLYLFGDSAGADSIFCLLGSDGVEDLIYRVILQSGPLKSREADREPMVNALASRARDLLELNHA